MAKPRCHAEAVQITEATVAPITFDTAMKHACSAVPVVNPANSMIEVKTLLWNGGYEGVFATS